EVSVCNAHRLLRARLFMLLGLQTQRLLTCAALFLLLDLGRQRHRRPVGHQNEQRRRRAKSPAGDAMLAGPTAVLVLNAIQVLGDLLIPLLPVLAAFDQQRLADVHVAEELFAAIGAKAGDELFVIELLDQSSDSGLVCLFDFGKMVKVFLGLGVVLLRGFSIDQDALGVHSAKPVGVAGIFLSASLDGPVVVTD